MTTKSSVDWTTSASLADALERELNIPKNYAWDWRKSVTLDQHQWRQVLSALRGVEEQRLTIGAMLLAAGYETSTEFVRAMSQKADLNALHKPTRVPCCEACQHPYCDEHSPCGSWE